MENGKHFLTPSTARRELLPFPLLSIMLIDETTCVSHTLLANWNKIAPLLFSSQSYSPGFYFRLDLQSIYLESLETENESESFWLSLFCTK